MSFLDLLEDTSVEAGESVDVLPPLSLADSPVSVEVLSKRSEDDLAQERLRDIEDSLYEQATTVVSNALAFTQIEMGEEGASKEVPGEWIAELGYEKAAEKHRTALYALSSSKEAPIGLKLAATVQASITKARAQEKGGPKVLNMTLVQMPGANVKFEEMKVKR
jgi:hypothetical protein